MFEEEEPETTDDEARGLGNVDVYEVFLSSLSKAGRDVSARWFAHLHSVGVAGL